MKGKYDSHYRNLKPEPIEVIENWELDFNLGNVLKYIGRAGKKEGESELKDLEKAKEYLDRKILKLREETEAIVNETVEFLYKRANPYKEKQVWTCANNPTYTLTIHSILPDGRMIVQVVEGDNGSWVYCNEQGKGVEQGFYDFQLTVLKRDVYDIKPKEVE